MNIINTLFFAYILCKRNIMLKTFKKLKCLFVGKQTEHTHKQTGDNIEITKIKINKVTIKE